MPFDTPSNYPGIVIRMKNQGDSVMFPILVNQALTKIASRNTEKKLLQGISSRIVQAKFGFTVCIQRADMTYNAGCETRWVGTNEAKRADEISAITPGKGSVTTIKYNPNMINTPDGKRPSWIGLAHELFMLIII